MDIPENQNAVPLTDGITLQPHKLDASSNPHDAVSSYEAVDRRQFLRVSGLAAGAALAGAAASRQAEAMGMAADHRLNLQREPTVTGAALQARKTTLFGIGYETWFIGTGG